MSGSASESRQEWHREAYRQLQLSALWACRESAARGLDEPLGETSSPMSRESSEWPPGAAELYRRITRDRLDDVPATVDDKLRLALEVWNELCTDDLQNRTQVDAAEFRDAFLSSLRAVWSRAEARETASEPEPASPPPIVFTPDPRQLAASWVAQAYTYSQDASFAKTSREQLSSSIQQESRDLATIRAASLPEDCLEQCVALEAQARQRLRLIKPILVRWTRDPEEIQFLESVSQLLSSFIEQGQPSSTGVAVRESPRRNGQNVAEMREPESIRYAIEELWQEAGPSWPPAALLDLAGKLSPAENFLSGLLERLTGESSSGSELSGLLEPDDNFPKALRNLPLGDRARLALVRAVADQVEALRGSRSPDEQLFARVAEWSKGLLQGCRCEAEFLIDEESAKARDLPGSACATQQSLDAAEPRVQKPGLIIRVGDAMAVGKQLVVVKPTRAGKFLTLLKNIESLLVKERKSSESFSNLLKSLTKSLRSAGQAKQTSLSAWWKNAANSARTELWLLLQELRVLAAQLPALEALNSKVYQALEQDGFQFPDAPDCRPEDSFTHNGNRWILAFDSKDPGGQTTVHRGLALRGPDNVTLAPAVCFVASRSGPGEHLLQLSGTLQQLLVRMDVDQSAEWQPLYQMFAGALAVGNHSLAIQPGLDLLTQTFRLAQDGQNSPTGVKPLRQQFCRAVYRCLVEICGVQVSPQLQGDKLELPQIKDWGSDQVDIEWKSSEALPGTIVAVDRFTDGSVPAQCTVSCGRTNPSNVQIYATLPQPDFQPAPAAILDALRHVRKRAVPWILQGVSLSEKLRPYVEKVQAACDGEGADWFHRLVSTAQAEPQSPADAWFQVLLKGGIRCYPWLNRETRTASWPASEAPGLGLKFRPHDEHPPGTAISVKRYATKPDRAQAELSLGPSQPYFTRFEEIRVCWETSQEWLASFVPRAHLQSLETATYQRALDRFFPTAEELIGPLLHGLLLAESSIRDEELHRDEKLDRLRILDQILQSVRQWGAELRWRVLPEKWVFADDVSVRELTAEERKGFHVKFDERARGTCALDKFGIATPGGGDQSPVAILCKGSVSIGPAPANWQNLVDLLNNKSPSCEASKNLRQSLDDLPRLKSKTNDPVDWQNAGIKIFEAFYDMCNNAEVSDEWRTSASSRFERFMRDAFHLDVHHPSPADLAEEWVEVNGNARTMILKEKRPALFGSDSYLLKANVDTD